MSKLLTAIRCRIGWHKRLHVIQTFGSAQHIGCPDCGRQYGIHHGLRTVIRWDADLADLYRSMGHDVDGPLREWRRTVLARSEPPSHRGSRALPPDAR